MKLHTITFSDDMEFVIRDSVEVNNTDFIKNVSRSKLLDLSLEGERAMHQALRLKLIQMNKKLERLITDQEIRELKS